MNRILAHVGKAALLAFGLRVEPAAQGRAPTVAGSVRCLADPALLPLILADICALIAGGYRRVLLK